MTIEKAARRASPHNTLAACIALALGASTSAVAAPGSGTGATPQAIVAVTNCNDSGPGSLRAAAALSGAVAADLSNLHCSTISLTSGAIAVSAQQLVIEGPGKDALTIDGNYNGRVFVTAFKLALDGVTITHGAAPVQDFYGDSKAVGGCIEAGQSVVVVDSVISACRAGGAEQPVDYAYGGGIDAADISLSNSTLSNNLAQGAIRTKGGGANARGSITLAGSTVTGNTAMASNVAADGGGVFARALLMVDSTLSDNTAQTDSGYAKGGGLSGGFNEGPFLVYGSTISGNLAQSGTGGAVGGGLFTGETTIYSTSIHDNVARSTSGDAGGGGVRSDDAFYVYASSIYGNVAQSGTGNAFGGGLRVRELHLANTTVANNTATITSGVAARSNASASRASGGGIYIFNAPSWIYNCTVAGNTASAAAGGIAIPSPGSFVDFTMTLFSTIVSGNSAAGVTAGIDVNGSAAATVVGDHDLVGSHTSKVGFATVPATGDPKLQALAGNGGPTPTMKLGAGSAAIDAGSNPLGLATDQRGAPFARRFGAALDIGAYEVQQAGGDIIFRNGFDPATVVFPP